MIVISDIDIHVSYNYAFMLTPRRMEMIGKQETVQNYILKYKHIMYHIICFFIIKQKQKKDKFSRRRR